MKIGDDVIYLELFGPPDSSEIVMHQGRVISLDKDVVCVRDEDDILSWWPRGEVGDDKDRSTLEGLIREKAKTQGRKIRSRSYYGL